MLSYEIVGAFDKDIKRLEKRHKDIYRLRAVMRMLICEEPLLPRHKNHRLHGDYEGKWECHVEPNWLLVYEIDKSKQKIVFHRTGTHSDLF